MTDDYQPLDAPAQHPEYPIPGVVEAFSVTADGQATPLETLDASGPPKEGFVWIHLNLDDAGPVLEETLRLPPLITRSLLAKETRPRCRHLLGGILINLRGINLNDGCRPEDMLSLRCWLEPGRIITLRKRRSVAVQEIRARYREGTGDATACALLIQIIRGLMDIIEPFVDDMADSLEAHEASAAKNGIRMTMCEQISSLRHDAVTYRRYLAPMRDAIRRLIARDGGPFISEEQAEIDEETDRATRVVEELDITIERASVIVDQMEAARSERINRNMVLLAIVSAIFLPLSFITGLLGVNVAGIPGTENPYAFGILVTTCVAMGGALGVWFKGQDWI
ncbi:MAG: zinc transporter ZntB [Pseudomonadota bacterium]